LAVGAKFNLVFQNTMSRERSMSSIVALGYVEPFPGAHIDAKELCCLNSLHVHYQQWKNEKSKFGGNNIEYKWKKIMTHQRH
jgi:hypothetical protein